jgi:anti-anti-sigma factor
MEVLRNKNTKLEDSNLGFDEKLDNISIKGSSLLGKNIDHLELFTKDNDFNDDFVIIQIQLTRATLKEASKFKDLLEETISNDDKSIIVDMNNCEFVDSSFLGVLVGGLKRIGRMGKHFYIVHDSTQKLPIFSATGLDKIFKVFRTVDEAIGS